MMTANEYQELALRTEPESIKRLGLLTRIT